MGVVLDFYQKVFFKKKASLKFLVAYSIVALNKKKLKSSIPVVLNGQPEDHFFAWRDSTWGWGT